LRNWSRMLLSSLNEMGRLSQLLFPNNPRHVRARKMQSLYFAVFISVVACIAVGVGIFLLNRARGH